MIVMGFAVASIDLDGTGVQVRKSKSKAHSKIAKGVILEWTPTDRDSIEPAQKGAAGPRKGQKSTLFSTIQVTN